VNERMQITPNIALSICEDCGAAIPVVRGRLDNKHKLWHVSLAAGNADLLRSIERLQDEEVTPPGKDGMPLGVRKMRSVVAAERICAHCAHLESSHFKDLGPCWIGGGNPGNSNCPCKKFVSIPW
jgi:hypothetical protein